MSRKQKISTQRKTTLNQDSYESHLVSSPSHYPAFRPRSPCFCFLQVPQSLFFVFNVHDQADVDAMPVPVSKPEPPPIAHIEKFCTVRGLESGAGVAVASSIATSSASSA